MGTILLLAGLGFLLIVAEMFLPGMVLGILGAIMLSASVVVGFSVYGAAGGTVVLCVVMTGSIIAFFLWMNFFQRTAVGRNLTLGVSLGSGDDLPEVASLLGKDGRALTDLRPAGKIEIDGRRLDVVAESAYVESGSEVTVVQAGGSRVVVRKKS
jgi:membrane-bound serine protease (ClpP class)